MTDLTMLALEARDASVVVTSITLVFGVLVALCLIITLEGKFFAARDKKVKEAGEAAKAALAAKPAAPAAPAPAAPAAVAQPAPAADGAIPGEIVAAITAAIVSLEGEGVTVRSIRRAPAAGSRRGAWGDAGVLQNTRPFI